MRRAAVIGIPPWTRSGRQTGCHGGARSPLLLPLPQPGPQEAGPRQCPSGCWAGRVHPWDQMRWVIYHPRCEGSPGLAVASKPGHGACAARPPCVSLTQGAGTRPLPPAPPLPAPRGPAHTAAPTRRGAPAKSGFLPDPRPVHTASDARRSLWHAFHPLLRMLGARVRGASCPWSSQGTWEETVHREVESGSDSEIPKLQSCSSGPLLLTGWQTPLSGEESSVAPVRDPQHGALAGRQRPASTRGPGLPCTRDSVSHQGDGHPGQARSQPLPACPERVGPRAADEAFAGGFHVRTRVSLSSGSGRAPCLVRGKRAGTEEDAAQGSQSGRERAKDPGGGRLAAGCGSVRWGRPPTLGGVADAQRGRP